MHFKNLIDILFQEPTSVSDTKSSSLGLILDSDPQYMMVMQVDNCFDFMLVCRYSHQMYFFIYVPYSEF